MGRRFAAELSIALLLDEKPAVVLVGSRRERIGRHATRLAWAGGLRLSECLEQIDSTVQLQHSLGRTEEKIIRRGTGIDVGKQRDQPNRMTKLAVLVDRMDWKAG